MSQQENIQEKTPDTASTGAAVSETPKGLQGKISQSISDYKEWVSLPIKNRALLPQAQKELTQIQRELMAYRLVLIRFTFRASHIDSQIWRNYDSVFDEFSRLEKETRKNTLRFRSLSYLRQIHKDWLALLERQTTLHGEIERAPASIEFYDKMMVHKESRNRTRRQDEALSQKFTKAYQSLESAIEYVEKFNRENDISIFGVSVLRIEDAREYWEERMNYIHQLEASRIDPEKILSEINKLKDAMYAAPSVAKWIHEVEQRFTRLKYDHELLVDSFGKAIIPDAELKENNTILTEMVPKLWATGQREQLDHYLRILEQFLAMYEPEVQSELTFAERHNMRRQGNNAPVETVAQPTQNYQQLIDLTKILISAIESREPTMANHSLMVSRLTVSTARQMNWPETDMQLLEVAALLHDVGKIWIPESVLTKEDDLNEEDIEILKKHPLYGAQLLESFDSFKEIAPWVYYHQERWDGLGYPEGLAGEDIPLASRIISVAESYNAMVSGHGSRKALQAQVALDEIKKESGSAYDPSVVEAFTQVMQKTK